jgi:MarR family 2-MHQ and catechol resistance regulon transcriptional repressor
VNYSNLYWDAMNQDSLKLYESFKAVFLHIDNHEKAYLTQFGLNIPRFYVLIHVSQNPGINYIELSDRMLCTKSNTTRVVQGMLKEQLITREVDPKDRRCYKLFLSDKGLALLDRVYPGFIEDIQKLMSRFSDDETSRFLRASQYIESSLSPDPGANLGKTQVLGGDAGRISGTERSD